MAKEELVGGGDVLGDKSNYSSQDIRQTTSEVICRIFFLRHGETENSNAAKGTEEPLTKEGQEQMKKAGRQFQDLGLTEENTTILYAGGTKRILESKEILEEYAIGTFQENKLLETTPKYFNPKTGKIDNTDEYIQTKATQLQNIIDLTYKEILKSFKDQDGRFSNKKDIIYLGHKSSDGFTELAKERPEDVVLKRRIEPGDISELDIDSNYKLINYAQHKEIFCLNTKNYQEALQGFSSEIDIQVQIKRLRNKEIQLFELQNFINRYFQNHPELYEKYFICGNFDVALFCFTNLIKNKQSHVIEKELPEFLEKELNQSQLVEIFTMLTNKEIGIQNNLKYIDLFLKIGFVKQDMHDLKTKLKEVIRSTGTEKDNFEGKIIDWIDYYDGVTTNYKTHILPQINTIRDKSLDKRFHRKTNKPILNNFEISDKEIQCNCLNILNNDITLIKGDGGAGKSFFSAHIQETFKKNFYTWNQKAYFPIFIQLNGKSLEDVKDDIEAQTKQVKDSSTPKFYHFESLDESKFSNSGGVIEFLELIRGMKNHNDSCIITSRIGYTKDTEIKEYSITGMKNPEAYIEDYFEGNQEKIKQYTSLRKKLSEEYTDKNALFVIILCELIKEGGDNLEDINSKRKLFETIIQQRLSKREGIHKPGNYDPTLSNKDFEQERSLEIENRYKALEEIAYQRRIVEKGSKDIDISKIIDTYGINKNRESLGFLLRLDDNGHYNFIHKSFENFFLLRYVQSHPEILEELIEKPEDSSSSVSPVSRQVKKIINKLFPPHQLVSTRDNYHHDKEYKTGNLLMMAAEEGYLEAIKFLVQKGRNINEETMGENALMVSCIHGKEEVVKGIFDKIKDPNRKNRQGKTAFMLACETGNLDIVKRLLDKKVKINKKDDIGRTAFMQTCLMGHLEIAKLLFEEEIDLNEEDKDEKNALILACSNGHLEIAKLLFEKEIDLNKKDKKGMTAFMWACLKGHIETVKWLLENKDIDLNEKDKDGMNALMLACSNGHLEIVKLLSEEGIDLNEKDKDGMTAFAWACGNGNIELVQRIFSKTKKMNEENNSGTTGLFMAGYNGKIEVIKRLYEQGMDMNEKDNNGITLLMRACMSRELETVKWLFDKVKNVDEKDIDGTTAFMRACFKGREKIIERLSDKVDINATDNEGRNALMRAVMGKKKDVVSWLSERLNMEEKDNQGRTALMQAALRGDNATLEILLSRGADINAKDYGGKTPFMWLCIGENDSYISNYWCREKEDLIGIQEKDLDGKTGFIRACLRGNIHHLKSILWHIKNRRSLGSGISFMDKLKIINEKDNQGKTGFLWACQKGEIEVIKRLYNLETYYYERIFEKGIPLGKRFKKKIIDIQEVDNEEMNGFMLACKEGNQEVVNRFLEKKINININRKNKNGVSAFMLACHAGNEEIVKLLCTRGAKIKRTDNQGRNAINYACRSGNIQLVKWLYEKGVDIQRRDSEGETPLMIACAQGKEEIINRRPEKELNIKSTSKFGINPVEYACRNGNISIVKQLFEKVSGQEDKVSVILTALYYASKMGDLVLIEWAFQKIISISIERLDFLISIAKENNQEKAIQLLQEQLTKASSSH